MKGKLLGFVVALLAFATIGVVQLTTQAQAPGQVGSSPRCTVTSVGPRGSAFKVNGDTATVSFTATGAKDCKVQVSTMAFYAPSITGRPYDQQSLFSKNTKVFGRGTHTMSVAVPTSSTEKKGCFYQLDLTYGTKIVSPVLAYGHGTINCQKPVANCDGLQVEKITRTKFRLTGSASTKGSAAIRAYAFSVTKAGNTVLSRTVTTSEKSASITIDVTKTGDYRAKLLVKTSLGDRNGNNCTATFTVKPPKETPKPGVTITKHVNNKKYVVVAKNESFTYQLAVTNTGNVDLKNVNVTDTPEQGVVLVGASKGSISGNTWSYTIPLLKEGETKHFTITAKVPKTVGRVIDNRACVDAKEVPGKPDACDHAKVKVPKPQENITVCELDTKDTVTIKESDFDETRYSTDFAKCSETTTPPELPQTGPAEVFSQVLGLVSLATAGTYYVMSRRTQ